MKDYYKENKDKWKKGGKYYYYKARGGDGFPIVIKRGIFVIDFN